MRSFYVLFLCALFMCSFIVLFALAFFIRSFYVLFLCAFLIRLFDALFSFAILMCSFHKCLAIMHMHKKYYCTKTNMADNKMGDVLLTEQDWLKKRYQLTYFRSTLKPKQKIFFKIFFQILRITAMIRMNASFLATCLVWAPIKYMLLLRKGCFLRAKERKQLTYKDHW